MNDKFDPRCHIGEVHGIYTIIDMLNQKDKYGHWIYKCKCNECGYIKFSHYGGISGDKSATKKCKHIKRCGYYTIPITHWDNIRIGNIFKKMIDRCYNTNDKAYRWYGAKGIKIYDQWLKDPSQFEKWSLENGYDNSLTIDRINSDKDYCPDNCQWISLEENVRKAGFVNWITVDDKILTGKQWAKEIGLGENSINTYIRKYGIQKTIKLIKAVLKEPLNTKYRASKQTWFDVYNIKI